MKKGFTLVELIVCVVLVIVFAIIIWTTVLSVSGNSSNISNGYGKNLQLLSQEREGIGIKYHFKDLEDGQLWWSYDREPGILYKEDSGQ